MSFVSYFLFNLKFWTCAAHHGLRTAADQGVDWRKHCGAREYFAVPTVYTCTRVVSRFVWVVWVFMHLEACVDHVPVCVCDVRWCGELCGGILVPIHHQSLCVHMDIFTYNTFIRMNMQEYIHIHDTGSAIRRACVWVSECVYEKECVWISVCINKTWCMYTNIYKTIHKTMYIYIYIYICTIFIYTYLNTCIYICMYIYIYIYISIYMYVCIYIYIYVYVYVNIWICMYEYMYVCIHTYI